MKLRSIGCLSLVGLLACLGWSNSKSDGIRAQLAVVERERLWSHHGAWPELERADLQLGHLEAERSELLARAQFRCDRLFQEKAARQLWEDACSDVQLQVEQATRQFQAETEQEMKAIHARFERQMKAAVHVPDRELQSMAAAALTRFRLEKQKEVAARVLARRHQLDAEVAQHVDDLQQQFQSEKVNLLIGLELREDPGARHRLSEIEQALETHSAARRQLAETELSDYTSIEEGQLALELRDYEAGLRRQLQPQMPNLTALQSQERGRLREVQRVQKAKLVAVVRNLEAIAKDRFRRQLSDLKPVHQSAGEILPEAFLKSSERQRLRRLPQLIVQAGQTRRRVAAHLGQGVGEVVAEQAVKRGRQAVLTDVRVNLDLEDLTDVSLAGVSELR